MSSFVYLRQKVFHPVARSCILIFGLLGEARSSSIKEASRRCAHSYLSMRVDEEHDSSSYRTFQLRVLRPDYDRDSANAHG